jgi:streptomycin 6-kinase
LNSKVHYFIVIDVEWLARGWVWYDRVMNERMLPVQGLVRQRLTHLGSRGEQWLAELPDLIAHLEREWAITVGRPLAGGSASYVVRARTAQGQDAVLKIAIPGLHFAHRVEVIARAEGRGYVRLRAYDVSRRAMLLEALGPSLAQLALPPERTIAILCEMLRQAWDVPGPVDRNVAPEDEKAAQLSRLVSRLWEDLGHPCSERVVTQALRYAERRAAAFDLARCVLVHGDPHPGNALQVLAPREGAESGFVFIDPDGFLAEPAYDLGVVLRDWCQQLLTGDAVALARQYCELLSAQTGIEETAIWEWGFLERVSTGLYGLEIGAEQFGRTFLQSAEMLV